MCEKIVPLSTCEPQSNYHFDQMFVYFYAEEYMHVLPILGNVKGGKQ